MALQYFVFESLTEVTNTTTTFIDVVVGRFVAADQVPNSVYALHWSANGSIASTTVDYQMRLLVDGSQAVLVNSESHEATTPVDYDAQMGLYFITTASTPVDIDLAIQVAAETAGSSAKAKNGRLVGFLLTANAEIDTSTTRVTTTSATFQNSACAVTVTPSGSTDYYVLAAGLVDVGTTAGACKMQITDGSNDSLQNGVRAIEDTSNRLACMVLWKVTGVSSSRTFTIQWNSDEGDGATAGISEMRLLAIPVSDFDGSNYVVQGSDNSGTQATYTTTVSQTFTPSGNPYITIASWRYGGSSNSVSSFGQYLDGTDIVSEAVREPTASGGRYPAGAVRVQNYAAASRTQALQRKSETTSTTTLMSDVSAILSIDTGTPPQPFPLTSNANNSSGAKTTAIPKPADIAIGDGLVAFVTYSGSATPTSQSVPSGWTVDASTILAWNSSTENYSYAAYKVADSGDAAASTFTFGIAGGGTATGTTAIMYRVTGVDPAAMFNTGDVLRTTTGASGIAPSLTTTTDGCLVLLYATAAYTAAALAGQWDSMPFYGTTGGQQRNIVAATVYTGTAYYRQGTAGATGTRNVPTRSLTTTNAFEAIAIALAPPSSGFTASVSESGTAADSPTSAATAAASQSEVGTASDAPVGALTAAAAITEAATAVDTVSGGLALSAVVSEAAAATDTLASQVLASIAETAAAADSITAVLSAPKSVTETAAAADTTSVVAIAAIFEAAAAVDTIGETSSLVAVVGEAALAQDSLTPADAETAHVSETATAADTVSGALSGLAQTVTEAASAADAITAAVTMAATVAETASALDAIGVGPQAVPVVEQAAASDAVSAVLASTRTITEAATALDTLGSSRALAAAVIEAGDAEDALVALATAAAAITEVATAVDAIGLGGVVPVVETASAQDFLAYVLTNPGAYPTFYGTEAWWESIHLAGDNGLTFGPQHSLSTAEWWRKIHSTTGDPGPDE